MYWIIALALIYYLVFGIAIFLSREFRSIKTVKKANKVLRGKYFKPSHKRMAIECSLWPAYCLRGKAKDIFGTVCFTKIKNF